MSSIDLIKLHGNVKIETFNGNHLYQKVQGDNVITKWGVEVFRVHSIASMSAQFGVNTYVNEGNTNNGIYYDMRSATYGFMKHLYLTDNADSVTVDTVRVTGNTTGYASRESWSGATANRGSINLAESYIGKSKFHIVFDFGTDKAIATHKSIFWADQSGTYYGYYPKYEYRSDYWLARTYTVLAEGTNGRLYGTVGTTLYEIDFITLEELATFTLPQAPTNSSIFDIDNGYVYFTTSSSSTTLYKFCIADSTSTTLTLPAASGTNNGSIFDGYLYYPYSSTRIYKFKLSDSTSSYNSITLPASSGQILHDHESLYYMTASINMKIYNFDTNTLTDLPFTSGFTSSDQSSFGSCRTLSNYLHYRNSVISYYAGTSSSVRYAKSLWDMRLGGANAITAKLLDEPVVKTADQTMKVTYEIDFA